MELKVGAAIKQVSPEDKTQITGEKRHNSECYCIACHTIHSLYVMKSYHTQA